MRGASLTTCLTLPIVAQNCAWSACLLPLLYHTPTLLSKSKTASSFLAANRHVNSHDRHSRNLSTTTQRLAGAKTARRGDPIASASSNGYPSSDAPSDNEPRKKKRPSRSSSSIKPQKKGKLPSPQKNKKQKQLVRPSTITAAEQTAFDRLIKEVSGSTTPEEDGEDILDQEEPIGGYDPNIDLDGIFEEAIKYLRLSKEQAAESAARNLSNPILPNQPRAIDLDFPNERQALTAQLFKRPLLLATGDELGKKALTAYERERLEEACDEHRTKVLGQLDRANSGEKIWQVLQEQVFGLVTRLEDDVKWERVKHRDRKSEDIKQLKGMKARRATAEGKPRARAPGKVITDVRARQRAKSADLSTTKAIPINELLLILRRNYAEYCLHTLRLFRRNHPTSVYALNVLATIKELGPISYVLGASTDLYNEFLFLQWTQYSDLHGMAETMAEMRNQGIEGNDVTVALIKGIARQRRRAKSSFAGPVMKAWWYMRGNVEGWRRMQAGYQNIIGKLAERAAAMSEEVESEDGALESASG